MPSWDQEHTSHPYMTSTYSTCTHTWIHACSRHLKVHGLAPSASPAFARLARLARRRLASLMRAIANEQLEGFPKRDELKSVFVEHEIEDEEARELGVRNAERNYSLSFNPPIYIYIYVYILGGVNLGEMGNQTTSGGVFTYETKLGLINVNIPVFRRPEAAPGRMKREMWQPKICGSNWEVENKWVTIKTRVIARVIGG